MAQPKLALIRIKTALFPLPPLSEQRRIVAKVDQLMRLCDELEVGLAQAESQRRKLVAAVLA
jgi:type I restriction enzyme S subunit